MKTPAVACLPLLHLYRCRMSGCREEPLRSTPPLERSGRRVVVGSQDGQRRYAAISPSVAAATSLLRYLATVLTLLRLTASCHHLC
ncbi:unnamed protein product [Lactuca virosa]|uniref:Secreted protein n=1 Tax=Lactuca virosa TaxID=75947 RepID=A0AAU9P236_9ASTR|nr:unnamed protein product [Lactuca virosa]